MLRCPTFSPSFNPTCQFWSTSIPFTSLEMFSQTNYTKGWGSKQRRRLFVPKGGRRRTLKVKSELGGSSSNGVNILTKGGPTPEPWGTPQDFAREEMFKKNPFIPHSLDTTTIPDSKCTYNRQISSGREIAIVLCRNVINFTIVLEKKNCHGRAATVWLVLSWPSPSWCALHPYTLRTQTRGKIRSVQMAAEN